MQHTSETLRAFEAEVQRLFLEAKIRGPVHLSCGNEEQLIQIFKDVNKEDWVFSTWRNHYHALLHGISEEWLMKEILAGNSIHVNNPDHHFYTSAIVGGIIPIAVGVAAALKAKGSTRKVWCFVGDMTAATGIFNEAQKYAQNFQLPITFVIEVNGLSTNTPTSAAWGIDGAPPAVSPVQTMTSNVWSYSYTREKYPHVGVGQLVHF